jgi:hypothetical protein
MTDVQHGAPGGQPGQPPSPPAGPPGYGWPQPPAPPQRGRKGLWIATAVTIVLATAALVVGIINLTRPAPSAAPAVPAPSTTTPAADTAAADKALCTEIAPMMVDYDHSTKALSTSGDPGSTEWNAALPKFLSDTKNWAAQLQPIIDRHTDADPFLRRGLQRFVDDRKYLIADLVSGPYENYDATIWGDSLAAGSGPLRICFALGVTL